MADSELLSQDEIDALLSGVDSGDVDTEIDGSVDAGQGRTYDFTSQDRLISGHMPTLEMINELLVRNLRPSLFKLLHRAPEISSGGVQLLKYDDYESSLLTPSNLNIVRIKPLHGDALIVCDPKLVFSLVDWFFSGNGTSRATVDAREFTATEMRIVGKFLDLVIEGLKEAWQPVLSIEPERLSSETNPHFVHIMDSSEIVVVSSFQIGLEAGGGQMQIAIPYSAMEPIEGLLDEAGRGDTTEKDARWSASLAGELMDAAIELNSTLTTTEVRIRDVLNFRQGDVLAIDLPARVIARVEDVPVFRAKYGVSRGNLALKVIEIIGHADVTSENFETGVNA